MAFTKVQTSHLVERLLSPDVQVPLQVDTQEVTAHLSSAQVVKVFEANVPGVHSLLFRQQRGQCVLKFLPLCYKDGWSVFKGTPLHDHLKWLLRLVVHHAHEGKPGSKQYLTEVAEAFMDCQAVQARVVERIGLEIRGVTANFRGLVMALAGEYKTMAVKMLAVERIAQGKAHDDATPTHYENRLTADLGQELGLNANDVKRAALDTHAQSRFAKLRACEVVSVAARGRDLFDIEALVQTLVNELNSFSAESAPNSLPRLFLDWASEHMKEKHIVFDEDTCTSIDVDRTLVMSMLEVLFLGQVFALADETYRGMAFCDLYEPQQMSQPLRNCAVNECTIAVKCSQGAADAITSTILALLASPALEFVAFCGDTLKSVLNWRGA